ncbi:hypothetical protein F4774DRAFT_389948 [Daldinia eschscholtzii]|nr:hypothetical protein F4774DRAFT_389948 [Daldinia eschscholtzii]
MTSTFLFCFWCFAFQLLVPIWNRDIGMGHHRVYVRGEGIYPRQYLFSRAWGVGSVEARAGWDYIGFVYIGR